MPQSGIARFQATPAGSIQTYNPLRVPRIRFGLVVIHSSILQSLVLHALLDSIGKKVGKEQRHDTGLKEPLLLVGSAMVAQPTRW